MSSTSLFFGLFIAAVILFVSYSIDEIWDSKCKADDISERNKKQIDFKVGPE